MAPWVKDPELSLQQLGSLLWHRFKNLELPHVASVPRRKEGRKKERKRKEKGKQASKQARKEIHPK